MSRREARGTVKGYDRERISSARRHAAAGAQSAEFERLVADIAEQGLLNPITLYQGQILDGRNRERACRAAGVEPRYVEFEGKDPAAFVLSQNLARRHLGPSERAMVAARMANLKWGQCSDRPGATENRAIRPPSAAGMDSLGE